MPSGLTNALTALIDLVNQVFCSYFDQFVIVFVDGILINSKSHEEKEKHLSILLQKKKLYAKHNNENFGLKWELS